MIKFESLELEDRALIINSLTPTEIFAGTKWKFFTILPLQTIKTIVVLSVIIVLIASGIILALDSSQVVTDEAWKGYLGKIINEERVRHCEPVTRDNFLFQKANSLTTFAYVLIGFWMVLLGWGDSQQLKTSSLPANYVVLCPALSITLGAFSILTGINSFIYHASYSKPGGKFFPENIYSRHDC
jgi:hypothetical protein